MKKTAVIFLFAVTISVRAEDFNWSWENGQAAGAPARKESGETAPSLKPVDSKPNPVSMSAAAEPAGSVPETADKAPAAGGGAVQAPAAGEDFFWAWEKDASKSGNKGGAKPAAAGNTAAATPVAPAEVPAVAVPERSAEAAPAPVQPAESIPPLQNAPAPAPAIKAPASVSRSEAPDVPSEIAGLSAAAPAPVPADKPADLPPTSPKEAVAEKRVSAVDSKAYDELIRENLDLHKKITEVKQDKDLARQENEKLARELKDLEGKIADSVGRIKDLSRQKEVLSTSPAAIKELESRLKKTEAEKGQLNSQLLALQKKLSDQAKAASAEKPAVATVLAGAQSVPTGSDLYKKMENENMLLKQKLGELELERRKAAKAREDTEKREKLAAEESRRALDEQKQMKAKLEEVKSTEKRQKKLMVDLSERIPDMEKEMVVLQKKLSEKDATIKEKERNLEALANEVQQRENRIRKAEKMVSLIEQAQKDVNEVSDTEKRDMHYNMAAVYSQVGRYKDAEREYLHALRLDPTDADVHYNLGILYDENLNDKQKAAMHYRRYLKLRPSGQDVDAVKNWLISLDMK